MKLPPPFLASGVTLEAAMAARRTVRDFVPDAINLDDLSQLLWAAQGISGAEGRRTAPSAGAFYPLELFVAARNVEGLAQGVYRYAPRDHSLHPVADTDVGTLLGLETCYREWTAAPPCGLVFVGVPGRLEAKYGSNAVRYLLIEVGHAAQNVLLEATALGLGAATLGSVNYVNVKRAAGLGEGEEPFYFLLVGHPRK